jgi:pimeloyl-ACP methyl ester carboxylesterase
MQDFTKTILDHRIKSSVLENVNGLNIHYLESGHRSENKGLIVLLHGFPELAFSWRKIMPMISDRGYHVIAPDQRGFGKTTGWDDTYTKDLSSYHHVNLVRDVIGLVKGLGYESAESVIGHDSGAGIAALSTVIRPDIYKSVVMMSAPFGGVPALPPTGPDRTPFVSPTDKINPELAKLERPRKHYQYYYRTIRANTDMTTSKEGIHSFLRGYYHHKSADWKLNDPFPLDKWSAEQLALMPTYYVMDLAEDMPTTVAKEMPSQDEIRRCLWLTDEELSVYSQEYYRTGFQGGLNWYRASNSEENKQKLELFSGMKIDVPSLFIVGRQDWGAFQIPGSLDTLEKHACSNMKGIKFVDSAGHWVQQEQPEVTFQLIESFLQDSL